MNAPENARSDEGFEALLRRIRPTLKQILGRYQIPPTDAEDVLQDTFMTLFYKWDEVQKPEAWLVGTLRRRCIMYWRSRRSRLYDTVDETILELVADSDQPSQEQATLRKDLERSVSNLRPKCRAILRMRYSLGLKPAEIAAELGYAQSSVRKVANRCLAALIRELTAVGFLKESSNA
ncbi:MAG: sigma-70 family RNA polymerase sigma factor [Acidobacteriota bacterium]